LNTSTVADCGERALVARIRERLTMPSWVVKGPGDDAAAIEPVRGVLEVLTTDAQIDGVHVDRRFVPPDAIGHRALAVNLSDLAAMGARPRAALLSLALPDSLELASFDGILDGLLALANCHDVALVGGNITRTPGPLVVDVTAIGTVHRRKMLTRDGAKAGDHVYVTGTLGDAATGLRRLRAAQSGAHARSADAAGGVEAARYLRPAPRVRAGMILGRNRAASSCMDLSDGLADGVRQIAEASGVGIVLDAVAIPIAPEVREWHGREGLDPLEAALCGGDDLELLFTSRPSQAGRLRAVRRLMGDLPITRIGVVTRTADLLVRDEKGARQLPAGYEHFR
jgi:thiamine-monophosphate kinase